MDRLRSFQYGRGRCVDGTLGSLPAWVLPNRVYLSFPGKCVTTNKYPYFRVTDNGCPAAGSASV
jgi:hypothetical protein